MIEQRTKRRPTPPGSSSPAGFTIPELMVVLMIISVFASMAVPRLRMSDSRRAQLVADDLAQKLEMGRTKALATRQMTRIEFDVSGDEVTGRIDHDEDGEFSGVEDEIDGFQEFDSGELDDPIEFGRGNASALFADEGSGAVTIPDQRIDFNTQGIPTPFGTQGAIYLVHRNNPDAVAAIWVASSGSFRVWRWREGEWQ